jgi:hypothetical protein
METCGDNKSIQIRLNISRIFFHTVPKLVQALVITYVDIFHSLAVEGGVLLPKTFLDLGFDCVVTWKSPASEMFFSVCQTSESPRGPSWGGSVGGVGTTTGFGTRTSPSAARAWKISAYVTTST